MTFNTIRLLCLLALGLLALPACHSSSAHRVPISGVATEQQATSPIAVEVNNPAGGVVVIGDATLDAPVVQARRRGEGSATDRVNASLSGSTLTVTRPGSSSHEIVDITVWAPQFRGVSVTNTQGAVRLIRVGGPVHVQSGSDSTPGGPIELRTDIPLTEGIRLATSEGSVRAIVPGRSAGRVDLSAPGHQAFIRSGRGELHDNRSGPGFHTATLNDGSLPIHLKSDRGDVTLEIIHDPFQSGSWPRH